jgi:hypothetical protein
MLWYISMPLYPTDGETLSGNVDLAVQLQHALLRSGIRAVLPQLGLVAEWPEPTMQKFCRAVSLDLLNRCDGLILAGRRLCSDMETEKEVAAMGDLKIMDLVGMSDAVVVEAVNVVECLSEMEENTTEVLA